MSTNYPTGLDSYTAHADGVGEVISAATINALQDAVAALQVKAGVTSSADASSLDYKVAHASGGGSGSDLASAIGVTTMPRSAVTTTWASGNQSLTLTGFVPQVSFTAARIKGVAVSTTTPTSAWLGIYSLDASGNGTLIATTANTPSIGTSGTYSVALVSPVALTAGGAYVLARLGVGAGLSGCGAPSMSANVSTLTIRPFCSASLASQTTLPASFTFASLAASTTPIYNEITV